MVNALIHFDSILNKWQFDLPNHNINKGISSSFIYEQLFVDSKLHVLNTDTGYIYTNQIDVNDISMLSLHNFSVNKEGRFVTNIDNKTIYIHQLIYKLKTNINYVINHIDSDFSNNKRDNLELITHWFNIVLTKKKSQLPIGIQYADNKSYARYKTQVNLPYTKKKLCFNSTSIDYLQNIHYQFATKSLLVTSERYLKELDNWLPDSNINFTLGHEEKLNYLIAAHLQKQKNWVNPSNN